MAFSNEEMHPTEANKHRIRVGIIRLYHIDYGLLIVHYWKVPDSSTAYINNVFSPTGPYYIWPHMGRYSIMGSLHNTRVAIGDKSIWLSGIYSN